MTGTDIVLAELPVAMPVDEEAQALPPSPYGDGPPYPNSTDRVDVVVYCTESGVIRQRVRCSIQDMHRQHAAWPGHDYLEVTGTDAHPERHIVDLSTGAIVARTQLTPGARSLKEVELHGAAAIGTFQSSATGVLLTYSAQAEDLKALMVAALIGGEISAAPHTPGQAMQALQAYQALRDQNAARLTALLQKATGAATLADLAAITW